MLVVLTRRIGARSRNRAVTGLRDYGQSWNLFPLFSHSVHLGAAYNQRKGAVGGPELWALCGGLENFCSVLPFSTFCVTSAGELWSAWVPTNVWDSVPQFSTCKTNKLNLPNIGKVWRNKNTDNHELPWILTWPLVTGNYRSPTLPMTENFCPVPVTQKLSLCPEAWRFLHVSKVVRGFSPLMMPFLMVHRVSDITS